MKTRKLFVLTFFLLLSSIVGVGQDGNAKARNVVRVEFDKPTYTRLEPIHVEFEYSVLSNKTLLTLSQDALIRIESNGRSTEFKRLTNQVLSGVPQRIGNDQRTVRLEMRTEAVVIDRVAEFFPDPGKYTVQFFLAGVPSNILDISIIQPLGKDREAHAFLTNRPGDISFSWIWENKEGLLLLEKFVQDFGDTVYGDHAISTLGNIYLAKGELARAATEFEKIRTSRRIWIASDAEKNLESIRQKLQGK